MKCVKCGEEISDNSKYCMFCGKKQPTQEERDERASYTNGAFLAKCNRRLFDEEASKIQGLSVDELYAYLHEHPKKRKYYQVCADYYRNTGGAYGNHGFHDLDRLSQLRLDTICEYVAELFKRNEITDFNLIVKEYTLGESYIAHYGVNEGIFETREECDKACAKAIEECKDLIEELKTK